MIHAKKLEVAANLNDQAGNNWDEWISTLLNVVSEAERQGWLYWDFLSA